jgi:DNA-binding NarL/FixJ family response regulator
MRAGATGYLTKNLSSEALGRAVIGALDGELSMPRRIGATLVRELLRSERRRATPTPSRAGILSVREREVLALVSAGLTDRAIGERLGISARTVGNHLGSILTKLGVESRAAAARAWKSGALDEPSDHAADAGRVAPEGVSSIRDRA